MAIKFPGPIYSPMAHASVPVRLALALALLCVSAIAGGATAQSADGLSAQGFQQVALTEETGRNAVIAYHELYRRYGDESAPASDTAAMVQAFMMHEDFLSTVQEYGFDDTQAWHSTLLSFILAYTVNEEGNLAEMQEAIAQIENSELPQATKEQLMAQYAGFIPSEENIEVAVRVAADPEIAAIIAEIRE